MKNAIEETNLFYLEDQFPEVDVEIIQTKNVQTWICFQGPPFKRKQLMKMFEELLERKIEYPKYENHNTFNKILKFVSLRLLEEAGRIHIDVEKYYLSKEVALKEELRGNRKTIETLQQDLDYSLKKNREQGRKIIEQQKDIHNKEVNIKEKEDHQRDLEMAKEELESKLSKQAEKTVELTKDLERTKNNASERELTRTVQHQALSTNYEVLRDGFI